MAIEDEVTAMLDEARDGIGNPAIEKCIAEAVYCYRADVVAEATTVRLLAPESVIRRFHRIVKRPQRRDNRFRIWLTTSNTKARRLETGYRSYWL